jgi:hypothetical protein
VFGPVRLWAQDTACKFDTIAHQRADSFVLGIAPGWRISTKHTDPPDYLSAAFAIQQYFRSPSQLRLPFWARTVDSKRSDTTSSEFAPYGFHGYVRFRLDDTGRLIDDSIEVETASIDLMESLVAAVRRADSSNAFSPPSTAVRHDKGRIFLRFVKIPRVTETRNVPLMRIAVAGIIVDSMPVLLSMPPLSYPEEPRRAGLTDRVLVKGLVRVDGRLEPGTIDLVRADYREFALEVMRRVQDARFRPASIGHCAVPTLVVLPVDFKIRHQ